MTDKEYQELEERIEQRNRIKAMADDLATSRKDTFKARNAESTRCRKRGEKVFVDSGESSPSVKSSGGLFQRTQIQLEG